MIGENFCPCGSGVSYTSCCQPLHMGTQKALTAEQLMRSRYAAFAKGEIEYLVQSLHPDRRSADSRGSIKDSNKNTHWLKLTILDLQKGSVTDTEGIVEFNAVFKDPNPKQLRERSRFIKEKGIWYYLDGEQKLPVIPQRNEPCWCQSGKKFKKCHGH